MAKTLDPLWETLLGLHQLSAPGPGLPVFAPWRRRAREALGEQGVLGAAQMLSALAPARASYWPDLLTPSESADGLEAGLEALRSTPQRRMKYELARAAQRRRLPTWCEQLATDKQRLEDVAEAFRVVYRTIIAPGWAEPAMTTETDRAIRARALRDGGVHGLLHSFRPMMDWRPPVLHVRYPMPLEIHLNGRGLRLIPSHFCWRIPVSLADPELPPTLVYPVEHPTSWAPAATRARTPEALAALLGRTRARVLAALETTATTGELARRLGISPASASEHIGVLRDADLAHSQRVGGYVVHTLTPLGTALLLGEIPPAPQRD